MFCQLAYVQHTPVLSWRNKGMMSLVRNALVRSAFNAKKTLVRLTLGGVVSATQNWLQIALML
jgi:hypothetical protein